MLKRKNKELSDLKSLTDKNDGKAIKAYLEGLPKNIKGGIFEDYLKLIFEHNGWLVKQTGKKGDAGADLLIYMEGNANPDFIIQAKNWNKPLDESDVGSELGKFEKKSSKKYSCKQYQLYSINGYTKSALKFSNYNIKLRDWSDIEELIDKYETTRPEIPAIELYAHNARAFDSINDMFEHENRVCVSHATGTGKSYLIGSVLQTYQDRNTIIAAPTNIILNELKEKFFYLMTNARLMTYSKLANIRNVDVGLVILDEFHRAGAVKWGAGVKRIMKANPDSIIFGTSATPYRYFEGRDMSDEIFEGNVASDLSLPKAIAKEILPSPKYVYGIYDINEESERVIENIENAKKLTNEQKNDYKTLLNKYKVDFERSGGMPEILRKHIKSNDRKFIIFCDDTSHLDMMELDVQKWFRKAFPEVGTERYIVHSKESGNDKELDRFKKASGKKFHLLFSIDMLNEGLHVDGVNGVVMLRRTASPRIFYQQIGRCIASGGYESPIIFDFVNNFNSIMATNFLSVVTEAVKSEQERRERDGLSSINIPVDVTDETQDIEEVFFSIESKIHEWLPFEEAREFVRLQCFNNTQEYWNWEMRPLDIPAHPNTVYANNGFISYPDWIGVDRVANQNRQEDYWDFEKARSYIRKLKLNSMIEFSNWHSIKSEGYLHIPSKPGRYYKDLGWAGYTDFLGSKGRKYRSGIKSGPKKIRNFEDARVFARSLKLKAVTDWRKYCRGEFNNLPKRPDDIPVHPERYKDFVTMYDWLGIEMSVFSRGRKIRSFNDTRKFARNLFLPSKVVWFEYTKGLLVMLPAKPFDIPANPNTVYKNTGEWNDWPDFLGNKIPLKDLSNYCRYEIAQSFAHKLKFSSAEHWRNYIKDENNLDKIIHNKIPLFPDRIYFENGWKSWQKFLGYSIKRKKKKYRTFNDAKKFVFDLGLKKFTDWQKYINGKIKGLPTLPKDIPKAPQFIYKNWKGWPDFLGYEPKRKKK